MDAIITLCIFITILFLYIHIANQFKKSEELEIYETDYNNNKHIEDVCELKQPFLMDMDHVVPSLFSNIIPENIAKYSSHDINMKDCHDYFLEQHSTPNSVDSIILPFGTTIKFLESDKSGHLFSENNQEFLDETSLQKKISVVDEYIKPSFVINSKYDLLFGSCNTITPLRYHTDSRRFLFVTNGKIKIKMTPWKNSKFLHPYKDYENYEFRSLVHPTKPHKDFEIDFEKTNFLEFEVNKGYMLYIPPYWWYSIIYMDNPSTYACQITYNTLINYVSNIKDISLYFLQQQNITKKINHKLPDSIIQKKLEIQKEQPLENNENVNESSTEIDDLPKEECVKDTSLNNIVVKDPLSEKEKENVTYSISNI
jgi:hypothetical protein